MRQGECVGRAWVCPLVPWSSRIYTQAYIRCGRERLHGGAPLGLLAQHEAPQGSASKRADYAQVGLLHHDCKR